MASFTAAVWPLAQRVCAFSSLGAEPDLGQAVVGSAKRGSRAGPGFVCRFDLSQSAPGRRWRAQKNGGAQALGRSRGGLNTKIHALSSNEDAILRFALTPGQTHDSVAFDAVYCAVEAFPQAESLSGDKAYDSDQIRQKLKKHGHQAVIPPKANRTTQIDFDKDKYKERNRIERAFRKLKIFRRIATRYDKLAKVFEAFICVGASILIAKINR